MIRIKQKIHFVRDPRGRHRIHRGEAPTDETPPKPKGRIPRVARLMALAIRFDGMLRSGKVDSQTTLAQLVHVTQPRMHQILQLNYLAPDIQDAILHLPRTTSGRERIHEKMLRSICAENCWKTQRRMWAEATNAAEN